jgi:hypothetical protein
MSISLLLLILQIIGAMPRIIEFAKMVWDLIKRIRDRRIKRQAKAMLRRAIWDRRSIRNMSVDETITCMAELEDIKLFVEDQLRKERGHA